jgi:hypothetical protein
LKVIIFFELNKKLMQLKENKSNNY